MKHRNPGQSPKSLRVQRYSPPAPGYLAESAATAMARGIIKSSAASSQSVMEPGPAWAAAGIQRVPTIQQMAKRVMSRRPSSRFSCGASSRMIGQLFPAIHFGLEFDADAAQAFAQELRLAAQPD